MQNLFLLLAAIIPVLFGKPASDTFITLKNSSTQETIAFQRTGAKGKVVFKYLDAGNYQLLIEFPQQKGKWIKEKPRHSSMTKAAYDERSETYYYQGSEGFFSVSFSSIRKHNNEKFNPVFREHRQKEGQPIEILNFRINRNGGQIKMKVKALTARQYQRKAEKASKRLSTLSIRGIK